jgi:hypothetical protein
MKNSSVINKLSINNSDSYSESDFIVNLGKVMKFNLIEEDILWIHTKDIDIRIDIDIASVKKLITLILGESNHDTK